MRSWASCLRVVLAGAVLGVRFPSHVLAETGVEEMLFGDIPHVMVASGRAENYKTAASNVTVITADEIKERGYRDLKDLLRDVAGYGIAYDRDEWVWWSRGVTSDDQKRFLYLIDGHSVSSRGSPHFSGQLTDLPNDLSNVKQVEVVSGPGAVFWGQRALGGIVNVVTKDAEDFDKKTNLGLALGTQDSRRGTFQFAKKGEGTDGSVISGTVYRSDGRDIYTDSSNGFANWDVNWGYTSSSGPQGRYTTALDRMYSGYRLQLKGQSDNTFYNGFGLYVDTLNRQVEINKGRDFRLPRTEWFIEVGQNRTFWDDMDVTYKAGAGFSSQEYQVVLSTYNTGGSLTSNGAHGQNHNLSVDLKKPFLDGKLDARLGFQYEVGQLSRNNVTSTGSFTSFGITGNGTAERGLDLRDYGFYGQLTYHVGSKLHLTAAGRLDFNDGIKQSAEARNQITTGATVSDQRRVFLPRMSVVWEMTNVSALKALYNTGFFRQETNNAYVDPEKIEVYELSYVHLTYQSQTTLTAYHQNYHDLSFLVAGIGLGGGASTITPGDEISQGFEIQHKRSLGRHNVWLTGQVLHKAYVTDVSSSFSTSQNSLDGLRQIPGGKKLAFPEYGFSLGGTVRLPKKVFVAPSVRNVGPQYIRLAPPTAGTSVDTAVHEHMSPLWYGNLNVGWEPNDMWGFFVYGNNVTNNRRGLPHAIRNGVYQPYGRYVEVKATMKF